MTPPLSPPLSAVRPLAGIRVLDASRVLAGPYASYLLSLLGADVVRIEQPPHGDSIRWRTRANPALGHAGLSTDYIAQAANKRVLLLDLDTSEGAAAFAEQVAASDVVVENFRSPSLGRRGLAPADFLRLHPALIWCSITGYGRSGARSQ